MISFAPFCVCQTAINTLKKIDDNKLQEMQGNTTTTQQKGQAMQHSLPETFEKLAASGADSNPTFPGTTKAAQLACPHPVYKLYAVVDITSVMYM